MKKILLFFVLLLPFSLSATKKITKQEVYSDWLNDYQKANKNLTYKNLMDSTVVEFIEHLDRCGVDTIGVFVEDFPGDLVANACQCKNIVSYSYVDWIKEGKSFRQMIQPCCKGSQTTIDSSATILYYSKNKDMIDTQYILPVITHSFRTADGRIGYNSVDYGHRPVYKLYCKFRDRIKLIWFKESQLEDQSSLFYSDNINSSIYHWLKAIQAQIKNQK